MSTSVSSIDERKDKVSLRVTVSKNEVFYDVLNKTYITGRSKTDLTPEQVSSMIASSDDEDLNQIKRSYKEACALLRSNISEYIGDVETATSSSLDDVEDFSVTFCLPSNINPSLRTIAADLCHRFLAQRCCGDWLKITNPTDADNYYTLATEALNELVRSLNKRVRPVRSIVK